MSQSPGGMIREARRGAGLSQASLAERLGTTQSAIARLERDAVSPRVETLDRALRACGQQLELSSRPWKPSVDETLAFENLRLSPGERLQAFERSYANAREFALAARKSLGRSA